MIKESQLYKILIVEDNLGDFVLVEEYISDYFLNAQIINAKSFKEFEQVLNTKEHFDIILLDLSLPDKTGIDLVKASIRMVEHTPIVVLTGYPDFNFASKSLSLGISDYLLKEDLNPATIHKCIIYNIERFKILLKMKESEQRYLDLFQLSPQPMWVYDVKTLRFLDVNLAAEKHYGYSHQEFLAMTIKDIRPEEEIPQLLRRIEFLNENIGTHSLGTFKHKKKSGEIFYVEVQSNTMLFKNRIVRIILANDVTERITYVEAIEKQNEKLREIAWMQSHVVRAPVARIMGLINLMEHDTNSNNNQQELYDMILASSIELDNVIRDIVKNANDV